jgi:aryl-alcohol dehydrogenase-like predicted oxidoreductase
MAVSWLRGRPDVVAPVAGARTLGQVPALFASAKLDLTADETAALDGVSARAG